jgi:hypothetical protein
MERLMRMLVLFLSLAVLGSGTSRDASAIPSWNKACWKAYYEWQKKPGHKAFALSTAGSMRGQNCGYSWSAPSKAVAEKEAIKQCGLGKLGIKATCYITESK